MTLTVMFSSLPVGNRWVVLLCLAVVLLLSIVTGTLEQNATKDSSTIPQLVFSCVASVIVGLLLVLDVQLLMMERAFVIGPQDVVFGVVTMYVDWVNLLRYIYAVCCGTKEGL